MRDEILKILRMEAEGKLTRDQAADLLAALADTSRTATVPPPPVTPPPPPSAGAAFATMRGVISTGSDLIADCVQSAVRTALGAVHQKDGNNSITMSRYEAPTMDNSVFTDNTIGVSQFSRTILTRSTMCDNSLQASTVSQLRLVDATLCDCRINGSSMDDVEVASSKMTDCALNGTKLSKVRVTGKSQLTDSRFNGSSVRDVALASEASLRDCEFNGSSLSSLTLEGSQIADTALHGSTLADTRLVNTRWTDVALFDYRITGSTFTGCELADVEFREQHAGAGMNGTEWNNCKIGSSKFIRCNMSGAKLYDLDLKDRRIDTVDFTNKTIHGNAELERIIAGSPGA